MGVQDKLRGFAEAREPDAAVVRDGISYGDVRELYHQLVFSKVEQAQAEAARKPTTPPPKKSWRRFCIQSASKGVVFGCLGSMIITGTSTAWKYGFTFRGIWAALFTLMCCWALFWQDWRDDA